MADKETKLVNEETDIKVNMESTATVELDEEVGFSESEMTVEDICEEDIGEYNELNSSVHMTDDMADTEFEELLYDIKMAMDSVEHDVEHDFEDNSLDDAVSNEDIVSATDELVTEIANDLINESEMKEFLFDDICDEDEYDLPDWESDDEDWVDEIEVGDDWESDNISSPFGEKLVSGLGRFGRLRRSSYLNNKKDDDSLDKFSDIGNDDPLFGDSSYSFGGDFSTLGISHGPFTSNNDYKYDESKSTLDNMKSNLEDKIECGCKKILDNKSLIASGIIGTVAVIGGIIVYKLFKNKSK